MCWGGCPVPRWTCSNTLASTRWMPGAPPPGCDDQTRLQILSSVPQERGRGCPSPPPSHWGFLSLSINQIMSLPVKSCSDFPLLWGWDPATRRGPHGLRELVLSQVCLSALVHHSSPFSQGKLFKKISFYLELSLYFYLNIYTYMCVYSRVREKPIILNL